MEKEAPNTADQRLRTEVQRAFEAAAGARAPKVDADTIAIVSACAGLIACVAYADRELSAAESQKAEQLLASVDGIGPSGARAIVSAIMAHVVELSSVHAVRFARTLNDLADRDLRLHIIAMLLELAAADDELAQAEVNTLRQVTRALGLSQDDYNRLQAEHRQKLAALRR
jgi:uncharacterized tellurite resistance protein B-like protein